MHDVTIIIPVFCPTTESVKWLDECVASAITQDCKIIVWNDGSPNVELIYGVLSKYAKDITFFDDLHYGVSAARNSAIREATTKFVFPLDCDDTLKPNAITTLLDMWDGTPLYPDVAKFGDVNVPHYVLLDFDCAHIYKYVGFSSVNVLHTKEQWKSVGGYDESIEFFEDGEYNARLFLKYCGKRCPQPLVNYRIHVGQRTDLYKKQASMHAKTLLKKIGEYEMACPGCSKNRRTASALAAPSSQIITNPVDVNALSLMQGSNVLARYIGGKGRGKHYYEGQKTGTRYKVVYGAFVYVNASDTRLENELGNHSLLVKVVRAEAPKAVAKAIPASEPKAMPLPEPALAQHREQKVAEKVEKVHELPDILNMTVKSIINSDDIDATNAGELLKIEKNGLNRVKVVEYLAGIADD